MLKTRSGLPKHCTYQVDRYGQRRVRFRRRGVSAYLTGIPWSEGFMRQYAAALDGVIEQTQNVGAGRTVAGSVNALVAGYLESSLFNSGAAETPLDPAVREGSGGALRSASKSCDVSAPDDGFSVLLPTAHSRIVFPW